MDLAVTEGVLLKALRPELCEPAVVRGTVADPFRRRVVHVRRLVEDVVASVGKLPGRAAASALGQDRDFFSVKEPVCGREELRVLEDHLHHVPVDMLARADLRALLEIEDVPEGRGDRTGVEIISYVKVDLGG